MSDKLSDGSSEVLSYFESTSGVSDFIWYIRTSLIKETSSIDSGKKYEDFNNNLSHGLHKQNTQKHLYILLKKQIYFLIVFNNQL